MSKSEENPKGVIYLLDEEKVIRKKKFFVTNSTFLIVLHKVMF